MTPSRFLTRADLQEILQVSDTTAHRIIYKLNQELTAEGFMVQRARVPRAYFEKRFNLESDKE